MFQNSKVAKKSCKQTSIQNESLLSLLFSLPVLLQRNIHGYPCFPPEIFYTLISKSVYMLFLKWYNIQTMS